MRNVTYTCGKHGIEFFTAATRGQRYIEEGGEALLYLSRIKIKESQQSTNASVQKLNIIGSTPNSILALLFYDTFVILLKRKNFYRALTKK